MKITVFQSDKGDCLLVSSSNGTNILADGGMARSYKEFVRPQLASFAKKAKYLDLVYVSHIDQDHIAGVLQLMDDLLEWKVYDYQSQVIKNKDFPRPEFDRPPDVKQIWHNSFHEQIGKNAGPIEDMLAAAALFLSVSDLPWSNDVSQICSNFATSKTEAAKLSRRISSSQLNIPLNPQYSNKLMIVDSEASPIKIGDLKISVIGPSSKDLGTLRKEWNKWLKSQEGRRAIRKIRDESKDLEKLLQVNNYNSFSAHLNLITGELGNREEVTPPNLASLMLLVEEQGKTALMTGDGHCDDIIGGLTSIGRLTEDCGMHVNVLKVQHHGSENNTNQKFCKRITADNYIFCGNGAHSNPDTRVVKAFIDSRIGPASKQSDNAEVGDKFKLWFNSNSTVSTKNKAHMKQIEKIVKKEAENSNHQMEYEFLGSDSFTILL